MFRHVWSLRKFEPKFVESSFRPEYHLPMSLDATILIGVSPRWSRRRFVGILGNEMIATPECLTSIARRPWYGQD